MEIAMMKKGYEATISELEQALKQAQRERNIAVQNLSVYVSEHQDKARQNKAYEESLHFWEHQALSKDRLFSGPQTLPAYYEMHQFGGVDTYFKRFIKCLCDMKLLKFTDYMDEYVPLKETGATEEALQAEWFITTLDNTYITPMGMRLLSGSIRAYLLHGGAYVKRPTMLKEKRKR